MIHDRFPVTVYGGGLWLVQRIGCNRGQHAADYARYQRQSDQDEGVSVPVHVFWLPWGLKYVDAESMFQLVLVRLSSMIG